LGSSLEVALSPSTRSGSSSSVIENPSVEAAAEALGAGVLIRFVGLLPPLKLRVTGLSETGSAEASAGAADATSMTGVQELDACMKP